MGQDGLDMLPEAVLIVVLQDQGLVLNAGQIVVQPLYLRGIEIPRRDGASAPKYGNV